MNRGIDRRFGLDLSFEINGLQEYHGLNGDPLGDLLALGFDKHTGLMNIALCHIMCLSVDIPKTQIAKKFILLYSYS